MNLCLEIDKFRLYEIYFHESIKNTVLLNSNFIRILNCNEIFTMNGIYFIFNLDNENVINNQIDKLINIEKEILNYYNKNTIHKQKIREQLIFYLKKIKNSEIKKFIIKISGIWENSNYIGITNKFIDINHQ